MKTIDTNNDGVIDFEEFIQMMQTVTNKHPTATHTREHTEQLEKSANLAFEKPELALSP